YGTDSATESCLAYVAAQCNGKANCSLTYNQTNCGGDPAPGQTHYGQATIACAGATINATPANFRTISFSTALPPNFVADADNVTASQSVAAPQPTLASHANVFDVTSAGAVGDAQTDDTQALQALIDAAPNGAVFYFPKGWYRVTSSLDFSRLT